MTKDEALEMAIDYLDGSYEAHKVRKACQEALEQPAQEPVAYADYERGTCYLIGTPIPKNEIKNPLYTHHHQWQGLTDDESIELIEKCTDKTDGYFSHLAYSNAVEQALKEKNTP
jgi:hypothetical protein